MSLEKWLKRIIDIVAAGTILLVLSPVLLIAALFVLILEGRPIFYNSNRFVSVNKAIRIPKFRTMVRDATSPHHKLNERFMRDGYLDIPLSCEIYTPIGRLLERTQIVEIPQLLCVLTGSMSLIGNRPLPKENIELLKKFPGWEERFSSPAGISGIAQVIGKYDLEPKDRLTLEKSYSAVYLNGNILACDLFIFWQTLRIILFGKGVPADRAIRYLKRCLPGSGAVKAPVVGSDTVS